MIDRSVKILMKVIYAYACSSDFGFVHENERGHEVWEYNIMLNIIST